MDSINERVTDRSEVFYWQTDRKITLDEAAGIWKDRHKPFDDAQIIRCVNDVLENDKLLELDKFDPNSQTSLGSVNHVRVGRLSSGKTVIVRCHPKGVINGYFHVESLASETARKEGLPSYGTYAVHDLKGGDNFSFQVCEKLPGTAMSKWLETRPEDERTLLYCVGRAMALVHRIKVEGFGPFDNDSAKTGKLIGLHGNFESAVKAGLSSNLEVLKGYGIFSHAEAEATIETFEKERKLMHCSAPVLVHNDFADWNLLTDGKAITGILDWDECVGSDPISDIACWSTFFKPERLAHMLEGYWSVAGKPPDFDRKFELLRFRYTISKMTLRTRRYTYQPTDFVKATIDAGKEHLRKSMDYFGI